MALSQLNEINKLLLAYSAGKYKRKGRISKKLNEFDTIISALNMLGEELFSTTVSRNYFSSIYNAVADMLFVLSPSGTVMNSNNAGKKLRIKGKKLIGKKISEIVVHKTPGFFSSIRQELDHRESFTFETLFEGGKSRIPVACTFTKIFDRNDIFTGYLLIAEDITDRKANEQKILSAVIDTQEKERLRISKDMHDSMGLHLAAQKMYIGALYSHLKPLRGKLKHTILSLDELNSTAISNMRATCFALMPSALEKNGIDLALRELIQKLKMQNVMEFHYVNNITISLNNKPLEISIYRIFQEFLNNSIKHAKAKNIFITLSNTRKELFLTFADDGIGFCQEEKIQTGLGIHENWKNTGHGLNNIATRVHALNGTYKISSKKNMGTTLDVTFPINNRPS